MISRRELLRSVAIAMAGSRVGGIPGQAAGADHRSDLVIAHGADISSLDPHLSAAVQDTDVSLNLFDTLVSRRWDNRLYPSLALTWTLRNPVTWEFVLRPGVVFHNGDPFTSSDVTFSIERTFDPRAKTLMATVFTTVDGIDAVAPHLVRFRMKYPDPLLPARLALFGGQILPRRYVESMESAGFRLRPVGTGPVRFVEWVKDDRVVLEAFADYWGGPIDAHRVVFKAVPEVAARVGALLRGEADIVTGLPPDHVDQVARHPTTRVEQALFAGLYLLVVDSRHPPLDDPRMKQALSLAIDRAEIHRALWHGGGVVPNGPIPKGDSFYEPKRPPLQYDPAAARQRLQKVGYRGETLTLEVSPGHLPNDRAMSEAIVAMWRDVGVDARLELVEFSVGAQRARERKSRELRWAAPASTLADPDGMMWRLLGPGGSHDLWRHARFDALGQAAHSSVDKQFRAAAYSEMTTIFLEHLPWIPVIQPMESYGVRRNLQWRPCPNRQLEIRRFNLRARWD